MSKLTNFLKLFEWDTSNNEDLNSNFNIDKALNENFDKIDNFASNCKNNSANAIKQEFNKIKEAQINSTGANLQNVQFFGESVQETREGYNKLKYPYASLFTDTIFTDVGDGTIKLNGTLENNTSKYFVKNYFLKAGTYTFVTGLGKDINLPNTSYLLIKKSTESSFLVQGTRKDTEFTLDVDSNIDISVIYVAGAYNNVLLKPMLILGTEEKPYEQYGAMPSIDYPSPISSITNIDYKATGKNIFDGEMELGSINWATGEFEDNTNCIRSKNYIEVAEGQYYAFSNSRNYTHNVYCYDKNKQFISAEAVANNTSYQIPANIKYIRFRTTQGNVENNLDTDFQIEKGSAVTDFEAYKEKTTAITLPEGAELCSLPNGVVDCVDSTGIINKKIGKMVLDGTGTYGFFPNYPGEGYCYYYEDARFKIKKVTGIDYKHSLCTHFTNVYSVWAYDTSKIGTYSDHPTLPRKYFVSDKPTLEEFKAQLAELQPVLIYELAEETTQNLAETEKTKLQNIETFEGVNNITSNAPISAVYNTDTKAYIDSKFNTLAQQLLNIVGGN